MAERQYGMGGIRRRGLLSIAIADAAPALGSYVVGKNGAVAYAHGSEAHLSRRDSVSLVCIQP